jgi:hypothetical protein
MQVVKLALAQLTFDPANARRHDQDNLAAVKGSLAKFGQQKNIVVDPAGVIRAGNCTVAAALELGWTEIWAKVCGELTEDEMIAFALADNRSAEMAEWDAGVLGKSIKHLTEKGFDVGGIGFDAGFIAALTPETSATTEGKTDPDDVPEPPNEPRTRPGDLWLLGNHRLLCGDATNVLHVDRVMGGHRADLVVTDQPYNIDYCNIKHPKFKQRSI